MSIPAPMPAALDLSAAAVGQALEIERRAFGDPWSLADFELVTADPRAINVGLWQADTLVGYAIGTVEVHGFHLASLAIDAGHRRQGWATRLLTAALERARSRQCRQCWLEVRVSNEPALRLYRKSGFVVEGVRRRFYSSPVEDAWLMGRPITSADMPTQVDAA